MKERLEALVAEMLEQKVCLDKALEEFEKQFIRTALVRSSGNQCKAAKLLHFTATHCDEKSLNTKLKRPMNRVKIVEQVP